MILGGMKLYTVHMKPDAANPYETAVFVREGGFNIWAFFFMQFWTLYRRLWIPTILLFAFQFAVILIARHQFIGSLTAGFIQLGLQFWVGFQANDWLRAKLRRQGYVISDIVSGDSLLRAEQRYFDRYAITG